VGLPRIFTSAIFLRAAALQPAVPFRLSLVRVTEQLRAAARMPGREDLTVSGWRRLPLHYGELCRWKLWFSCLLRSRDCWRLLRVFDLAPRTGGTAENTGFFPRSGDACHINCVQHRHRARTGFSRVSFQIHGACSALIVSLRFKHRFAGKDYSGAAGHVSWHLYWRSCCLLFVLSTTSALICYICFWLAAFILFTHSSTFLLTPAPV
jgi:hypothetical protein